MRQYFMHPNYGYPPQGLRHTYKFSEARETSKQDFGEPTLWLHREGIERIINPQIGMSFSELIAERKAKKLVNGSEGEQNKFDRPLSASELLSRNVETLPKLIDPIFPKVGVVCLAGASDSGKSAFLRQLCLHVVTNEERFIGFPVNALHNRAIYVSTEDDSNAISFLLNLQNKAKHYQTKQLEGLSYIFQSENLVQNLQGLLSEAPVDVVVIDCFTDLFGGKGSLNESTQVRAFLQPYSEMADKYQCLFIFLHHTGKRSEEFEPSKKNLLGSQGIEAKMRMVAELRQDPNDSSLRHFCIVKGNYLPREFKSESFELRFDENMLFHNNGNRKPFDQLQKKVERSPEHREHLVEQVKELASSGKSQREIAKQLNIGLGTVNNYLNGVHVQVNP